MSEAVIFDSKKVFRFNLLEASEVCGAGRMSEHIPYPGSPLNTKTKASEILDVIKRALKK